MPGTRRAIQFAQRRPERQLRRHLRAVASTKQGLRGAQRRPERQLRRHLIGIRIWTIHAASLNEGRSVNSGDTDRRRRAYQCDVCCAQRRPERQLRRHHGYQGQAHTPPRSTKAGASTPATQETKDKNGKRIIPLNEGRSVNSGDTRDRSTPERHSATRRQLRSTKAGASTPATQETGESLMTADQCAQRRPERQLRRHPPPTARAQRRPERQLRRHDCYVPGNSATRSTKAGASTPATQDEWADRHNRVAAQRRPERQLRRHGRDVMGTVQLRRAAQRRPERQLRRHPPEPRCKNVRSTKAGASTPATLLNSAKGQYRDKPSLVHGCGSLAADVFAAISRDFGRYPVKMVRSSSRDCLNRGQAHAVSENH